MRGRVARAAGIPPIAVLALAATTAAACASGEGGAAADGDRPATSTASAAGAPPPAAALPERFGVGRAATPAEVAAWDRDVDASGRGLPPGRGTHAEGARIYAARCAACHGARGEGLGPNPRLVQAAAVDSATGDSFPFIRDHRIPKTVGNYWPYATTLFDYVRHAMPYDRPGSLGAGETYALVAFLLAENGVVPRTAVIDARALPKVEMPTRRRFVEDDRRGGAELR